MRYLSLIFWPNLSAVKLAEKLEKNEYRDDLESSWNWKDLPGMAPDYASPVDTVDYGDMPG